MRKIHNPPKNNKCPGRKKTKRIKSNVEKTKPLVKRQLINQNVITKKGPKKIKSNKRKLNMEDNNINKKQKINNTTTAKRKNNKDSLLETTRKNLKSKK